MSSPIRIAWPLAVSGFLPPQCHEPWPPSETGGSAGTGGVVAGAGGTAGDTGGTSETGGTTSDTGGGGSGGDTGGAGGAAGAAAALNEPVLGCSSGVWPDQATYESLPSGTYYYEPERITEVSANGEVVVGFTSDSNPENPEAGYIRRPAVYQGSSWQHILPEALSTNALVNCDGTVFAGGYDRLRGFIKRAGHPPVLLVGKGNWATEPSGISADGTRVVGNLAYRGDTWTGFGMDPVVWTDLGAASYLWPKEPRMALHIRFDGGLVAGLTDHCNYPSPPSNCGVPEHLFTSTGRPNETIYADAPAKLMSSDGSTFADDQLISDPNSVEEQSFIRLFRPSSGLTMLPCPYDTECSVVDISSRGNILLVDVPRRPALWTERHGFRWVSDILAEDGVRVPFPWFSVLAMSDDGRVIVGHGYRSGAVGPRAWQAFRLTLPRKAYD